MDDQRTTKKNQTPPSSPRQQHFANGFPVQPLSAAVWSNTHQMPVNLPPSIDVDQSLSNAFFHLNISQNDTFDSRSFLPPYFDYEYGGVSFPIGGEGFPSPFRSNNSLDESFRVSNGVNNNLRIYSGVGPSTSLTVDPRLHSDYQNSFMLYRNQEPFPGAYSSGFDLEFDQRCNLLAKERLYNSRYSPSPIASTSQGSITPNHNFCISGNNVNRNYGGMLNKSQNNQSFSVTRLKDLRGIIYLMAKDQNGCKILQSKFDNPTEEEVELVLSEVLGSIADLMKDQFGNYLIQKLVTVCNDDQKALMIRELTGPPFDIIFVSMSPFGTRAVQKLLENLKSANQIMMVVRALQRGAAKLAIDLNGHHVIQHCLLHFDSDFNQLILHDIANNCFKVATDRSGCCVLQACVEHCYGEVRNRLVSEIMAHAIHIAEDPFGNYVLQHMVGLKSPELTQLLVRRLQGNFAYLSTNKYASNVVERCLIESGPDISSKIILELIGSPNPSSLLTDPYANFVIQSALKVSKGFAHECLRKLISRNMSSMQSNVYGKKILEKIIKRKAIHL